MAEAQVDPPPPHISNVEEWGGHPDRNYYVFAVLSIVFGFFGLDHFYLRSFETGFKKLVVNIFGLGLWYMWDVIQVLTDGAKIRKEGLSSPLDWIRGIGYGVFTDPSQKGGEFIAKKSYLVYAVLAIFLGCFGLDKFYMGYAWQGIAKLLSCFNIFLFLFGWLWVAWDSFHAFFMTKSVLTDGITPPMPYSFVFDPIPGDAFLVNTPASEVKSAGSLNPIDWFAKAFGLPPVPSLDFVRGAYKDIVAPLMTVPVIKALQTASSVAPSMTMPEMPTVALPKMAMPDLPTMALPKVAMPEMPTVALPKVAVPKVAVPKVAVPEAIRGNPATGQSGGGASAGPGPVIAGALTAVVLAGGLKGFYDMISAQYR